ncbi:dihydrolipoyl dehydrogenase family protein [Streptomyces sp. NPDC059455]|uniref:dihydrolipoyl dehydrogenase family protein n=1 Tax=Streptomyces sp. NPDC059455 TaxID=3346837 RepID=UPI0036820301
MGGGARRRVLRPPPPPPPAGLSTVIVERELVGGECSYWACVPSKSLLRPVLARAEARQVPGLREAVGGPLAAADVFARRDKEVGNWKDDGALTWLESAGIDLVRGHGRLVGPRRVTVTPPDGSGGEERTLTARHAVAVCTGTRAALPDMPGIAEARPWTSREATSSGMVPERLIIVGGGVVAAEMATAWCGLGSRVTVLVRGSGLLNRIEPFAGELVAETLREAGAEIRTGTSVKGLARPGGAEGPVTVTLESGEQIEADEVLFATGRAPHTADVGLETVGLEPGGWLTVDETCRVTDVPDGWLYAAGDVNHRALLTHQGKYQARIAGAAIGARARGVERLDTSRWGEYATTADEAAVPQVVFTDPEVAAVGLTAEQAEAEGRSIRVVDYDMGQVEGAALYADGYRGRARMVVDLDRGHLIGVTFVGPGVSELLHSATVAVAGEVPINRLWHAVPSFPTISEIWLRLLEAYRG